MKFRHEQTRNKWRDHVAAARLSSQSVASYCRSHNLSLTSFYIWRRKLENAPALTASSPNPFSRLEVVEEISPRLPDAKWLADFVRHLSQGRDQ